MKNKPGYDEVIEYVNSYEALLGKRKQVIVQQRCDCRADSKGSSVRQCLRRLPESRADGDKRVRHIFNSLEKHVEIRRF
jgi:hypothetical protein